MKYINKIEAKNAEIELQSEEIYRLKTVIYSLKPENNCAYSSNDEAECAIEILNGIMFDYSMNHKYR